MGVRNESSEKELFYAAFLLLASIYTSFLSRIFDLSEHSFTHRTRECGFPDNIPRSQCDLLKKKTDPSIYQNIYLARQSKAHIAREQLKISRFSARSLDNIQNHLTSFLLHFPARSIKRPAAPL